MQQYVYLCLTCAVAASMMSRTLRPLQHMPSESLQRCRPIWEQGRSATCNSFCCLTSCSATAAAQPEPGVQQAIAALDYTADAREAGKAFLCAFALGARVHPAPQFAWCTQTANFVFCSHRETGRCRVARVGPPCSCRLRKSAQRQRGAPTPLDGPLGT